MEMPTLLACLSTGKGTWSEVIKIINSKEWDKVILITNEFGKDKFSPDNKTELIVLNFEDEISILVNQIKKQIKVSDFEIALNIISGAGREHMALLQVVLELGLNFRLVTIENNQLKIH